VLTARYKVPIHQKAGDRGSRNNGLSYKNQSQYTIKQATKAGKEAADYPYKNQSQYTKTRATKAKKQQFKSVEFGPINFAINIHIITFH